MKPIPKDIGDTSWRIKAWSYLDEWLYRSGKATLKELDDSPRVAAEISAYSDYKYISNLRTESLVLAIYLSKESCHELISKYSSKDANILFCSEKIDQQWKKN
jgi:hypothetical protein